MPLPPGFLLINKPATWTSFDVVNYIRKEERRKTGQKNIRVGHAGTLDPFATGLLIVGVGREATRELDQFKNLPKTYEAVITLGATSTTGDPTGTIVPTSPVHEPSAGAIKKTLESFIGKQEQTPPMFSAKKIGGKKLYELARAGKTVERQPSQIEIFSIQLLEYAWPELKIEATCSAGTYIRTLAEDIGKKLGTGAYCSQLTRTKVGEYNLQNATHIHK
jgi:tRNA pseudouridine55 synthase